jgi:hypothetical protein
MFRIVIVTYNLHRCIDIIHFLSADDPHAPLHGWQRYFFSVNGVLSASVALLIMLLPCSGRYWQHFVGPRVVMLPAPFSILPSVPLVAYLTRVTVLWKGTSHICGHIQVPFECMSLLCSFFTCHGVSFMPLSTSATVSVNYISSVFSCASLVSILGTRRFCGPEPTIQASIAIHRKQTKIQKHENAVSWDVTPCGSCKKQRFGGTYALHQQGEKNRRVKHNVSSNKQPKHATVTKALPNSPILVDLMIEEIRSLRNVCSYKSH